MTSNTDQYAGSARGADKLTTQCCHHPGAQCAVIRSVVTAIPIVNSARNGVGLVLCMSNTISRRQSLLTRQCRPAEAMHDTHLHWWHLQELDTCFMIYAYIARLALRRIGSRIILITSDEDECQFTIAARHRYRHYIPHMYYAFFPFSEDVLLHERPSIESS